MERFVRMATVAFLMFLILIFVAGCPFGYPDDYDNDLNDEEAYCLFSA